MNIRTVSRDIWHSNEYSVRVVMTESERFTEQYPGGEKFWYNIPGTLIFTVETDTTSKDFPSAMSAFKYAETIM